MLEVDGKEESIETSNKFIIERWLTDFKAALDLGAAGIKVRVKGRGKYGVVFE